MILQIIFFFRDNQYMPRYARLHKLVISKDPNLQLQRVTKPTVISCKEWMSKCFSSFKSLSWIIP